MIISLEVPKSSIEQNLDDLRWREIFILIAGLLRHGDEFLKLMEEKLQSYNYLNTPKLRGIAKWVAQAANDSGEKHRPVIKRAALYSFINIIFYEQRDLDKPHAYRVNHLLNALSPNLFSIIWDLGFPSVIADSDFDDFNGRITYPEQTNKYLPLINDKHSLEFACNLVRKFEENKIFRNLDYQNLILKLEALQDEAPINDLADLAGSATREGYLFYVNCIRQVWLEYLDFQEEWLDLPYEESYALANYLYISELIVRCKEATVHVSEGVWREIEDRILTDIVSEPPNNMP